MYLNRPYRLFQKRLKGTFLEKVCYIYNAQRIAQIRFVAAKFQHRLLVADDWIRRLCYLRALWCKFIEGFRQHFFAYTENILLCCKAHFKIKLIKFSRRTVRPRILIPEARRNLEIFVKAGYHQKLLVLLRRLRQCVEFSLKFTRGNNIVSRTLR